MIEPLGPAPGALADPDGRLLTGLWAGEVTADPVADVRQRGGRVRRWAYAAGGNEGASAGAAVADVGLGATAFVWVVAGGRLWTWERTSVLRRGMVVARRPSGAASAREGRDAVVVGPGGAVRFDVGIGGERVTGRIESAAAGVPAVCATPTPAGGWNVTQKLAGQPVTGEVTVAGRHWDLDGGGWSDWTAGRQDRRTSWRWAAGAGVAPDDGRTVGLNVSTGMNGAGPGEDVVWWDGVPYPLDLTDLAPATDDPGGAWRLTGPGWELAFAAAGVRAADENLLVARSRYVQPIGGFEGTLPGPDGAPVPVRLVGVTEQHDARW